MAEITHQRGKETKAKAEKGKSKKEIATQPSSSLSSKDKNEVEVRRIAMLVVGSTGTGKSTWLNYLHNYGQGDNPLFETSNFMQKGSNEKPTTSDAIPREFEPVCYRDIVEDGRKIRLLITAVDTPGLNEAESADSAGGFDEGIKGLGKDGTNMLNVFKTVATLKAINALVFCVPWDQRYDAQFKPTLNYYCRLFLPLVQARNVLVVFTRASDHDFKSTANEIYEANNAGEELSSTTFVDSKEGKVVATLTPSEVRFYESKKKRKAGIPWAAVPLHQLNAERNSHGYLVLTAADGRVSILRPREDEPDSTVQHWCQVINSVTKAPLSRPRPLTWDQVVANKVETFQKLLSELDLPVGDCHLTTGEAVDSKIFPLDLARIIKLMNADPQFDPENIQQESFLARDRILKLVSQMGPVPMDSHLFRLPPSVDRIRKEVQKRLTSQLSTLTAAVQVADAHSATMLHDINEYRAMYRKHREISKQLKVDKRELEGIQRSPEIFVKGREVFKHFFTNAGCHWINVPAGVSNWDLRRRLWNCDAEIDPSRGVERTAVAVRIPVIINPDSVKIRSKKVEGEAFRWFAQVWVEYSGEEAHADQIKVKEKEIQWNNEAMAAYQSKRKDMESKCSEFSSKLKSWKDMQAQLGNLIDYVSKESFKLDELDKIIQAIARAQELATLPLEKISFDSHSILDGVDKDSQFEESDDK